MIQPVPVTITIALLILAIIGMGISWRRRGRRQSAYSLPATPAFAGTDIVSVTGLYLATTFAGRPLDRVVAAGLGFRARAVLTVTTEGVRLERDGADSVTIPLGSLVGAGIATWTIDRTVEKNGLTVLGWRLDNAAGEAAEVESAFRIDLAPRADFIAAVRALIGAQPDDTRHPAGYPADQADPFHADPSHEGGADV